MHYKNARRYLDQGRPRFAVIVGPTVVAVFRNWADAAMVVDKMLARVSPRIVKIATHRKRKPVNLPFKWEF